MLQMQPKGGYQEGMSLTQEELCRFSITRCTFKLVECTSGGVWGAPEKILTTDFPTGPGIAGIHKKQWFNIS